MPRKKSDREKKAAGTYRPDREGPPPTIAEAQAKVITIAARLEETRKQAAGLTGRKKAKAEERARILADDLEIATEDFAKATAAQAEQAAAPSIRDGLELMSYADCLAAQPPLSDSEEIAWLHVGPRSTIDLAQRKLKAGLPLTAEEKSWLDGLTKPKGAGRETNGH